MFYTAFTLGGLELQVKILRRKETATINRVGKLLSPILTIDILYLRFELKDKSIEIRRSLGGCSDVAKRSQ